MPKVKLLIDKFDELPQIQITMSMKEAKQILSQHKNVTANLMIDIQEKVSFVDSQ